MKKLIGGKSFGVFILLFFYFLMLVSFSVLSPWFFSFDNMTSIGSSMAFIGLMAVFGTPLIIAGGLDLSVAATAGLAGVVVSKIHAFGGNIWLACLLAILTGALIGVINGLFTSKLKLNPLIVTLGTMSVITGASLVLTNGLTQPMILEEFNWLGSGFVFLIPVPIYLLAIVSIIWWWIMNYTIFGRSVYACGDNPETSMLVGLSVNKIQMMLYILSGISGALAGIILAAMLGAAAPNSAGQQLLTVITAIILGGTSLYGGIGSIWGTVLAVLILGTLNNGLTLLDVSSFWQDISKGALLLMAVSLDKIRYYFE